jgi:membrane associated rhomboid family serine protease
MNNNLYQDLKFKIFRSGNPVFFYIGINTVIFVFFALVGVVFFLSGNSGFELNLFVREYFGFPASFSALPLRFYTIITYQFFHDGFLHLLFNMLWLYWMGQIFLDFLKPRQFHFVYLGGGVLGALVFTAAFHVFPVFEGSILAATVIGASASVMAIVVATATLVPDFSIRLLLIGDLKLKYLALAYILIDLIGTASANAGGSFTHLGGALFGFFYIKLLKGGIDWSSMFKKKTKMKVVKNETYRSSAIPNKPVVVNQDEIDSILDKISRSGYDKLSRDEKETLFKASKH